MSRKDEPEVFEDVEVKTTTDKALLCVVAGTEVWIPKSQLGADSELTEDSNIGDTGTLVIPQWLAEAKGLV